LAGLAQWFEQVDADDAANHDPWSPAPMSGATELGRPLVLPDGSRDVAVRSAAAARGAGAAVTLADRSLPMFDGDVAVALERVLLSEARRHGIEVVP
jgi:hypothetical protein